MVPLYDGTPYDGTLYDGTPKDWELETAGARTLELLALGAATAAGGQVGQDAPTLLTQSTAKTNRNANDLVRMEKSSSVGAPYHLELGGGLAPMQDGHE